MSHIYSICSHGENVKIKYLLQPLLNFTKATNKQLD